MEYTQASSTTKMFVVLNLAIRVVNILGRKGSFTDSQMSMF